MEKDENQNEQEWIEPPANDLVAIMAKQTRLLQALAQGRHSNNGKIYGIEGGLSEFLKFKLPTFNSTDDPLEADDWLREINKKLDIIRARGRDRVLLATHQLVGAASEWWDNYSHASKDPNTITWNEIQKAFRDYHIPESIMEMKAEEFWNLKQGLMTILQYIRKFLKLSCYALDDISTDKKKHAHRPASCALSRLRSVAR